MLILQQPQINCKKFLLESKAISIYSIEVYMSHTFHCCVLFYTERFDFQSSLDRLTVRVCFQEIMSLSHHWGYTQENVKYVHLIAIYFIVVVIGFKVCLDFLKSPASFTINRK
uniref:Uncharacterized protein n=1 Tax=Glossina brevipalpis TaxID=37001 RepID=A0A1A9W048_9MUSC